LRILCTLCDILEAPKILTVNEGLPYQDKGQSNHPVPVL
jgi:hypothetical protein